jgi:hypothetical protein
MLNYMVCDGACVYPLREMWIEKPIDFQNEDRFFQLSKNNSHLHDERFVHGIFPGIFRAETHSKKVQGSTTLAGVHKRLSLICDDHDPRFNPAIMMIPPSSPLASIAPYLGIVRAGGGKEPWLYGGQPELPRDPPGGVYYRGSTLTYGDKERVEEGKVHAYCELLLLNRNFDPLIQVGDGTCTAVCRFRRGLSDYDCFSSSDCYWCEDRSARRLSANCTPARSVLRAVYPL